MLRHSSLSRFAETFWIYYIALTSLLCGVFLVAGLFTRVVAAIQVPVLIGAVLFINPGEHAFALNSEFVLSFIVLAMLAYFLLKGAGEISMDTYRANHEI